MFNAFYQNCDDPSVGFTQKHNNKYLIHNPPQPPLTSKELDEIKEIAKQLKISKPDKFTKQDLIYKILDQQALNPADDLLEKEKKSIK